MSPIGGERAKRAILGKGRHGDPRLPTTPARARRGAEHALRRELYFYGLYRLLEASILILVVFGPVAELFGPARHEVAARTIATTFAILAMVLFAFHRRGELRLHALLGVGCDLVFGLLAIHAIPAAGTGIALMLLFNVGSAALLLPTRLGAAVAIVAVAGLLGEHLWSTVFDGSTRHHAEPLMFSVAFLALATLTSVLGRQMRDSYALAAHHGEQAAHLVEVNDLIIRRLRTGVLLVDGRNRVNVSNEAASALLGDRVDGEHDLTLLLPELARRLAVWRETGLADETPLRIASDAPEVVPRFARLLAGSDQTLVFLDDTAVVSRKAESMTLATLGRFSASLAHEIRNPLAAINYAVQLLQESEDIHAADRRLLEIIHQQGKRMNGIVDNVLGLARREPAKPEYVELAAFARRFVDEYRSSHPLEQDELAATSSEPRLAALVDPRQLHQVLTVLVHNALTYGRMPGEPARVTLHVHRDTRGTPLLDVRDRGPGIPEGTVRQLFHPFFTTSEHGTGLGLYIARELSRSNGASLDYISVPGGGACFRITLAGRNPLLNA